MYGGVQDGWCEVVPSAEANELLRLALVVGADRELNLNEHGARQSLQQLFTALDSVEAAGRRLRDVALARLVRILGERPGAFSDLYDLAQVARVTPTHLQRLLERADEFPPAHPSSVDPGADHRASEG